ncbi:plastocyanin/azurin family copper-binding protein [Halococcus sp. IIIV-5B]|uniref:plastocyanin/azurin family copper-binding protein n=1 Tax=Halococcus sp. IIIV-5B TaxID=2321230 RepID=UPI000E726B12|nr:plastocyanin/azurin family copper-binding protein [Halococcus sp. IIIV-5B]RJT07116.1 halocyanin [Halococcus sp. IIIV-5B]
MDRRQILKVAGFAATGGLTGLTGCSSSSAGGDGNTDSGETGNTNSSSNGETNTILMITEGSEYYFDPIGLFVESGETITFENDSGGHSATAYQEGTGSASVTRIPDGAEAWDSGVLSQPNATFEYTFETAGTYDYFCTPHKSLGMVGRVVVNEPGGPAEGSMPQDGDVPESQTIVDQRTVSYSDFSD